VIAGNFKERVVGFLGVDLEDASGRTKRGEVVRLRELLECSGVHELYSVDLSAVVSK
jgi:hypothetical protein